MAGFGIGFRKDGECAVGFAAFRELCLMLLEPPAPPRITVSGFKKTRAREEIPSSSGLPPPRQPFERGGRVDDVAALEQREPNGLGAPAEQDAMGTAWLVFPFIRKVRRNTLLAGEKRQGVLGTGVLGTDYLSFCLFGKMSCIIVRLTQK